METAAIGLGNHLEKTLRRQILSKATEHEKANHQISIFSAGKLSFAFKFKKKKILGNGIHSDFVSLLWL